MLRRILDRLTYANVVATIALFVALGGVSYAVTLPRHSVGTAQLKKNAVKSPKVKDNSLKSRDIRNNSLTHRDVRNNSLRSADVRNGSLTGADVRDGSLGVADIGDLPAITPTHWAAVDGSGTGALRRARGFTDVVRFGTGQYRLAPTTDVAGCAWLATAGDTTTDGSWGTVPALTAVTTWFGGQVRVELYDAAGVRQNRDFSVAAFC